MDKKTGFIAAYLGAFTLASILACGGGLGGGEPCTIDDDCPGGYVCDQDINECVETCTTDIECAADEKCLPRPNVSSGLRTCQFDNTQPNNNNPNNNPNNTNQDECQTADDCGDPDAFFCNDQKKCEPFAVVPDSFVIQIQDTTTNNAACTNNDPGSDFIFARVVNSRGEILGYGQQIVVEITEINKNRYQGYASLFNGNPPDLSGGEQCPSAGFKEGSVVAVGCFGYILTQFVDNQGAPIPLRSGLTIEVGEYGTQCNGSNDDSYEVSVCTDTAAARQADPSSCSRKLGTARGFGSFTL